MPRLVDTISSRSLGCPVDQTVFDISNSVEVAEAVEEPRCEAAACGGKANCAVTSVMAVRPATVRCNRLLERLMWALLVMDG